MFHIKLSLKNHPFFKDLYDVKPHSFYLKFERKLYDAGINKRGVLDIHLKSRRVKFNMTVTHLAMILGCSRPQYLRKERGENCFKDEQLELLAALYGEDVSTYKDMQDVNYLFKKIGYDENPERAVHLLNLAIRAVIIPSDNDNPEVNLSSENDNKIFNVKPISKEIQQQKIAEIVEKLHRRFQQNDVRMTEIGKKLAPMAGAPNPEKAKLW